MPKRTEGEQKQYRFVRRSDLAATKWMPIPKRGLMGQHFARGRRDLGQHFDVEFRNRPKSEPRS